MRNCSIALIYSDGAYGFNNVIRVKASYSVFSWNINTIVKTLQVFSSFSTKYSFCFSNLTFMQ